MRVVEPKSFKEDKPAKKRLLKSLIIILVVLVFSVSTDWYYNHQIKGKSESSQKQDITQTNSQNEQDQTQEVLPVDNIKDTLRIFSDNEFRIFYDNLLLPNLDTVENPPVISGNDIADARIRKLAEDRGYRLRKSPTIELVNVDGFKLQPVVSESWSKLKASAASAGLNISIVSGYRSVNDQRALFLQRLSVAGGSIEAVANGSADEIVNKVLVTSSIPGYSKHHTGYTIDILCAGYAFENFKNSPCNTWITKDNYKVAKEAGFIPSYPPTADLQGPDPEAWEYVWVGTELLYE